MYNQSPDSQEFNIWRSMSASNRKFVKEQFDRSLTTIFQIQLQPNLFSIWIINLGVVNGAKVGLKLRLDYGTSTPEHPTPILFWPTSSESSITGTTAPHAWISRHERYSYLNKFQVLWQLAGHHSLWLSHRHHIHLQIQCMTSTV